MFNPIVARTQKPADILEAALQNIKENGWYKGDFQDKVTGAVCMLGAVNAALDGDPNGYNHTMSVFRTRVEITRKYILPCLANSSVPNMGSVARFNDDMQTTREDVIKVLREAIELAKKDKSWGLVKWYNR